ncbi:unnamed protein product [Caenorhabditis sp. 36 PRJEB53466]|nr:unnamed protein product [Caenorhabditis sp. 36 PRJEB53466]
MNDSWPVCATAFELTFHPLYRSAQFYALFILMTAVAPLTYFIFWKMISSTFHGNLKWVMTGYFGSVLIFTFYYGWISSYHSIIPFFAVDKCDLIIDRVLFKYGHIAALTLMTIPMFFPFAISIERFYATMSAEHYERTRVLLGPLLTVITVIVDCCIIAFIYKDEAFDDGSVSFAFIPNTSALRMFSFYWVLFFLNIFNFCINILLLRGNRRLKKLNNSSLAVRYQLEEVYLSTKFAVTVIFVHILFFGCYVVTVILVRYHGSYIFTDSITLTAVRGATISMIATYNFTIGFVAVYLYKRIQSKKMGEIRGNVQMKATGRDGAKNYDDAIFSVWNSLSSTNDRAKR